MSAGDDSTERERLVDEGLVDEQTQEEFRVATEELQVQQQQIDHLLGMVADARSFRERVTAGLAMAVYVTDERGLLRDVNAAAAAQLGVARHHLLGRPFAAYVSEADRSRLRGTWARLTAEGREVQVELHLARRGHGEATPVVLHGLPHREAGPGDAALTSWFAFPATAGDVVGAVDAPGDPGRRTLDLARVLSSLTSLTLTDRPTRELLRDSSVLAAQAFPTGSGVSLTVGSPDAPTAQAADSTFAQAVDGVELRTGQGPCLDAYTSGAGVLSGDVTTDPRWPRIQQPAAEVGVCSVLAHPVAGPDGVAGVLNVYGHRPQAFGDVDLEAARLITSAFGAILAGVEEKHRLVQLGAQLYAALDSRGVIDQAKGMIMLALGTSADEAFARLATASRRSNVKVRTLAELVVSRELSVDQL